MAGLNLNYKTLEEVPEDMRNFCTETGEGDAKQIVYDPTGLQSALQKERKQHADLKSQSSRLAQELEGLKANTQKPKDEQPKDQPPKEDVKYSELEKKFNMLKSTLDGELEKNEKLERKTFLSGVAKQAGLRHDAIDLVSNDIAKDAEGYFVKGSDGLPVLNPRGERVSPLEHLQGLKPQKGWMFENQAASPSGVGGRAPAASSTLDQLAKALEQKKEAGDTVGEISLIRQAQKLGLTGG